MKWEKEIKADEEVELYISDLVDDELRYDQEASNDEIIKIILQRLENDTGLKDIMNEIIDKTREKIKTEQQL